MINRLFVYGTLAPGKPNEHILKNIDSEGKWIKAIVKGQLFESGWGAAMGYPGIIPDKNGEMIEGLLFISDRLVNHWNTLDEFEGDGYERVIITAIDDDANIVDAYIYKLKEASAPPVASADDMGD